jgi:hypothetical protein
MRGFGKYLIAALIFAAAWPLRAVSPELKLEDILRLDNGGALWTFTVKDFEAAMSRNGFSWLSDDKDEARAPLSPSSPRLLFFGMRSWETTIKFSGGTPESVRISLYNRGDAGECEREDFDSLRNAAESAVSKWLGKKASPPRRESVMHGKNINTLEWDSAFFSAALMWSSTGATRKTFRAEYITLELKKPWAGDDGKIVRKARGQSLTDNVVRKDNGDVFIDNIPMVDQGAKGYCAAATAERVFRYYGLEVDQHMMAQITDTDSGGGTDVDSLTGQLKRAGVKFGIKLKTLYTDDTTKDFDAWLKLIDRYNAAAKKAGKPRIRREDFEVASGGGTALNITGLRRAMDGDILMPVKCAREKKDFNSFLEDVKKNIQAGIPPVWWVELGIFPEKGLPQLSGGHLRLITGFNNGSRELIYSDSWGAAHDFKKMSFERAWTITQGVMVFVPKNMSSGK